MNLKKPFFVKRNEIKVNIDKVKTNDMYSVSPLVVPKLNSYLVRWMGSNLVALTSAISEWILACRVSIESLGYRECCIRVWV